MPQPPKLSSDHNIFKNALLGYKPRNTSLNKKIDFTQMNLNTFLSDIYNLQVVGYKAHEAKILKKNENSDSVLNVFTPYFLKNKKYVDYSNPDVIKNDKRKTIKEKLKN